MPETPRRPGHMAAQVHKQALNLRMDARVILRLKQLALDEGRSVSDLVTELAVARLQEAANA